jgi:hypothetical protein
MNQIGRS